MASTRTRGRTARPLIVSGDVDLDAEVASWEVELVASELTSIPNRVGGQGEPSKKRRQSHAVE
jgi:hypothetical protein